MLPSNIRTVIHHTEVDLDSRSYSSRMTEFQNFELLKLDISATINSKQSYRYPKYSMAQ